MVASRRKQAIADRQAERERRREELRLAHDAELEERRVERRREREERRLSAHPHDYSHADAKFEEDMATQLKISVAEFRELQARRREEMGGKSGGIVYSPDHKVH